MKVGVIGLGLIGGSILKALSCFNFELYAVSKSSYKKAFEYTKNASDDINLVKDCDVVFVCSEMKNTLKTLEKLNDIVNENTIVADVSSVKSFLIGKTFKYNFISSHPMAGKEKIGFEASSRDLFENAYWIIEKENEILKDLILKMKAKPIVVNLDEHDKATALISHLPLITSIALFNLAQKNDLAMKLASSGFRDMTRLAAGSTNMTADILEYNFENIEAGIEALYTELTRLKNMTESAKMDLFLDIQAKRLEMYDENGKNTL